MSSPEGRHQVKSDVFESDDGVGGGEGATAAAGGEVGGEGEEEEGRETKRLRAEVEEPKA